jgi:hypothetical protein
MYRREQQKNPLPAAKHSLMRQRQPAPDDRYIDHLSLVDTCHAAATVPFSKYWPLLDSIPAVGTRDKSQRNN